MTAARAWALALLAGAAFWAALAWVVVEATRGLG